MAAALISPGSAVTLLAVIALPAAAIGWGADAVVLAVPVALIQLLVMLGLSKVVVAGYGLLLRSRLGAVLGGAGTALFLAFAAQGWAAVVAIAAQDAAAAVGRWTDRLPSGWGLDVLRAVGAGERRTCGSARGAALGKELRSLSRDRWRPTGSSSVPVTRSASACCRWRSAGR